MLMRKAPIKLCLAIFVLISMAALSIQANIINVSDTGGDDLTGDGSIGAPYQTIQKGIDMSSNNDTVYVHIGVYSGNGNRDINPSGKEIYIYAENPDTTVIDVGSTSYDGFILQTGEDTGTVIDGFLITGADRGIYLQNCGAKIRNCDFSYNTYGVYKLEGTQTLVENCNFYIHNTAIHSEVSPLSAMYIWDCLIDSASNAGIEGDFEVSNTTIKFCHTALKTDPTWPGYQFAAYNCTIIKNHSFAVKAGDISYLENCIINDNYGEIVDGFSFSSQYIHLTLEGCQITHNNGGIDLSGEDVYLSMQNTVYDSNSTGINYSCNFNGSVSIGSSEITNTGGDGINITSTAGPAYIDSCQILRNSGYGIYISYASAFRARNNTIKSNQTGIYINEVTNDENILNNIISHNTQYGIEFSVKGGKATNISCNNVRANAGGNYTGIADQGGTNGNISLDPQYCDGPNDDLNLLPISPCRPGNNSCGVFMGSEFEECGLYRPLVVTAYSPVNIKVTDPEGFYIGKDKYGTLSQTLFPADYFEDPPDYNDEVVIYYPIEGEYTIEVIAEDGAGSGETYSVGVRIDGSLEVIVVSDENVPPEEEADSYSYTVEEGYHYMNGDANRDEAVNLLDITFLINYLYKDGLTPYPEWAGDSNCDYTVNLLDITYDINYLYKEGPEPCVYTP